MLERFSILNHNKNPYVSSSCPLIMTSHAITKDKELDRVLVQCKFENLEENPIIAFYVKVLCYTVDDLELPSTDEFSYLDLNVNQYEDFGSKTAIPIENKNTRKVTIIPQKIVFLDKSIWINKSNDEFIHIERNLVSIDSLGELSSQYKRNLKGHVIDKEKIPLYKTLVNKSGIYTTCGCGKILLNYEKLCPKCGINLKVLENLNDEESLRKDLVLYKEQQQKIKEEKRELTLKSKSKSKKLYIVLSVVGIFLGVFLSIFYILNSHTTPDFLIYQKGINHYKNKKYDQAMEALAELGDYKDSIKIRHNIAYEKAILQYEAENLREALDEFIDIKSKSCSDIHIDKKELEQYIKDIEEKLNF